MGLLDTASSIVGRFLGTNTPKKDLTLDELWQTGSLMFDRGGSRLRGQRQYMAAYLDWVYAAVNAIVKDSSTIEFHAYANRGGTKTSKIAARIANRPHEVRSLLGLQRGSSTPALQELDNHVLLDLLDSPNPLMDGQRFQELTDLHILLAGEAFWGVIRNGLGKPEQLWPMMPYGMTHHIGADGTIQGWTYRIGGTEVPWEAKDILHFPLSNPNNIYRGMSVIQAAARAIDTDTHAADWNRAFFANSARPDLALETEATLTPQVFQRMKEQWNDEHRGAENAHKVAILEQGLKLNKLSMSQKDMDFLESRKYSRDQIFAMFTVSRVMVGLIEGDGRSNMEAAEYNHAKRAVKPIMARKTSVINHKLAPEFDKKLVIGFTDPVPEDKDFMHKMRTDSTNLYRTVNEVRAELGDEPIQGGDTLFISNTMVPLEQAIEPPQPAPAVAPPADQTPPVAETDPADEGKKSLGKR